MDPRLAQDVPFNAICSMTTNDSVRNGYLKSFKFITQIKMNPNASHQSYILGGGGLILASMMVPFVMCTENVLTRVKEARQMTIGLSLYPRNLY
jgi:hypothetical protein